MKTKKTIGLVMLASLFLATPYLFSGKVETPTKNFETQISKGTVVLDFFSIHCGPCNRFAPTFAKVATEFSDIKFIKIDVDKNNHSAIVKKYKVRGIPALFILKDGKIIAKKSGLMSAAEFKKWIKSAI